MARRKASDLENQMSLMDMMASESPEYTEEGPEELLDPGEDTGDGAGQTDKPFKLVANKTTKAKANISTQALSVVKAVYADTVEIFKPPHSRDFSRELGGFSLDL